MLTVQGLVDEMGLDLVAGRDGAGAPIRWVHASELPDPTPWLSGGELILTTGMQLDTPDAQRGLVDRLASHHVAGLGFCARLGPHPHSPGPPRGGRGAAV